MQIVLDGNSGTPLGRLLGRKMATRIEDAQASPSDRQNLSVSAMKANASWRT
jgi:hypothetical protein